ncbi:MAG: polysaccharide pyruvyl transferase CsaB, partial [Cyanobacteriota bacterium]
MVNLGLAGAMRQKGKQLRPLLCGYYGEHNIGDDALLAVLLSQVPPGSDPLVTARDEPWVVERFGVGTCDRRRLGEVLRALWFRDVLVLGGGSLLQDATSLKSLLYYCLLMVAARLQGKSVLLWGQGLGPLRRPVSRVLVRLVLPLATVVSWRDEDSGAAARRLGRRQQSVGSDPVWAYPIQEPWRGKGGPIVLCWRPVRELDTNGWLPYLKALATLVADSQREVIWLPFHQGQYRGLLQLLLQAERRTRRGAARGREGPVA